MSVKLSVVESHNFWEGTTAYEYKVDLNWRKDAESGCAQRYFEDATEAVHWTDAKVKAATANGYQCWAAMFHWSDGDPVRMVQNW